MLNQQEQVDALVKQSLLLALRGLEDKDERVSALILRNLTSPLFLIAASTEGRRHYAVPCASFGGFCSRKANGTQIRQRKPK